MVSKLEIWPYIIPLPSNLENQCRFLRSIFGSDTALDILKNVPLEGRLYQKDLMSKLGYSNKTVIKHLKTLVSFGVLEEGMEKTRERGKTLWLKWYTSTSLGKWLVLLLTSPENVNTEVIEDKLEELFELYVTNAVKLYEKYGLNKMILRKIFDKTLKNLN
jgi:predicted transcriptional regulator